MESSNSIGIIVVSIFFWSADGFRKTQTKSTIHLDALEINEDPLNVHRDAFPMMEVSSAGGIALSDQTKAASCPVDQCLSHATQAPNITQTLHMDTRPYPTTTPRQ